MVDDRDPLFAPEVKVVPAGIAYRLLHTDSVFHSPAPRLTWDDVRYKRRTYYTDQCRMLQVAPLISSAIRLRQSDPDLSLQYLNEVLKLRPDAAADLSKLSSRDRDMAESTNERFAQIEQLRNDLLRTRPH